MCSAFEAASTPLRVKVSKSEGVWLDWADGHRSYYELSYLRDRCPCARCSPAGGEAASPFQIFKPAPRLAAVERVGNYALRLSWADGHDTGIYTWQFLREICPCAECSGAGKQQASPGSLTEAGS